MLKFLLPKELKVYNAVDDIRLKSNLTTNKTIRFTENSFFYVIFGFTQSHSGPLDNINGFFQMIPGIHKSDKPNNITGIKKIPLKCDCVRGSTVNGIQESILFNFALDQPPRQIIYKEPNVKLFEKIKKSVLSHITFSIENDDHKPVDSDGESISFTCQIIKI